MNNAYVIEVYFPNHPENKSFGIGVFAPTEAEAVKKVQAKYPESMQPIIGNITRGTLRPATIKVGLNKFKAEAAQFAGYLFYVANGLEVIYRCATVHENDQLTCKIYPNWHYVKFDNHEFVFCANQWHLVVNNDSSYRTHCGYSTIPDQKHHHYFGAPKQPLCIACEHALKFKE